MDSALKSAQATLANGIHRLRVASSVSLPGPLVGEGESLAHGTGGLLGGRDVATGGGRSSLFFAGGLGSGGLLRTIIPSASTGDSFTVIPGLGIFGDPHEADGDGFKDARDFVTKPGGDPGYHLRLSNARQEGGGTPSTAPIIQGPRYAGGPSLEGLRDSSPTVSA
jgi:hypothetical protein